MSKRQDMDSERLLEELFGLADRLGITVRRVRRGGDGGGVARVGGMWTMFTDMDAAPREEVDRLAASVSRSINLENIYISPRLRDRIVNTDQ